MKERIEGKGGESRGSGERRGGRGSKRRNLKRIWKEGRRVGVLMVLGLGSSRCMGRVWIWWGWLRRWR